MPDFRFYLERGNRRMRELRVDLPDATVVSLVAKTVAHHYAASEIGTGRLHLAQDITVLDCNDFEVGRYPLASFLCIEEA